MQNNNINVEKIDINEVITPKWQTNPGMHVWYLANMEEAGIYGAYKATWQDENDSYYNASVPALGGFLTYPELQLRSTWWVMKAYADIVGDLVYVEPDSTMEGIAGIDEESKTVRMLLGRSWHGSEKDEVIIKNIDQVSWIDGANSVHIVAKQIPNSVWDPLIAPNLIMVDQVSIQQNVLRLRFPEFGHYEALYIEMKASPYH